MSAPQLQLHRLPTAAICLLVTLQVWLWNLESGAVRRKLLPQGHASRPVNEQPVERLAFMHGDHR
jgi:hypothetical protein